MRATALRERPSKSRSEPRLRAAAPRSLGFKSAHNLAGHGASAAPAAPEAFFNQGEVRRIVRRDEGDGHARAPCASGAADSMRVVRRRAWQVVIDHSTEPLDIEPPRSHVRRHQHLQRHMYVCINVYVHIVYV